MNDRTSQSRMTVSATCFICWDIRLNLIPIAGSPAEVFLSPSREMLGWCFVPCHVFLEVYCTLNASTHVLWQFYEYWNRYNISAQSVKWEPSFSMRVDRQTDGRTNWQRWQITISRTLVKTDENAACHIRNFVGSKHLLCVCNVQELIIICNYRLSKCCR